MEYSASAARAGGDATACDNPVGARGGFAVIILTILQKNLPKPAMRDTFPKNPAR
jgi:hypothetical protein